MAKFEQGLHQKMLLKMSPQQIQLMKLLQIPAGSLEERIKEELEANPALEDEAEEKREDNTEESISESPDAKDEGSEQELTDLEKEKEEEKDEIDELEQMDSLDDYLGGNAEQADYMDYDEVADYKMRQEVDRDEQEKKQVPLAMSHSFQDYLEGQLVGLELNEHELELIKYMIGCMDEDGYLRRDLDAMTDDILFSLNVQTNVEELEAALAEIQSLEPAGIGARDLRECLLLQLYRKPKRPEVDLAIRVVEDYMDAFSKKHFEKIEKLLGIDEITLKNVIAEITHLNPKPGRAFSETDNAQSFLVPDFYIVNEDGKLQIQLNSRNIPELRVSNAFREMMQSYQRGAKTDKKQKEALVFIKQKIDGAKWFIDAMKQRQQTLLLTMNAILQHQYTFFSTGDETTLRPMILKDIAEVTGLDISTVSRVSNSKFVQTEFGTYKLKFFFSESLTTDEGEEVSSREVKKILTDLISMESKKKPLSDEKLMEELNKKGYNIARRTVAKYREQLNIPVARMRKEL